MAPPRAFPLTSPVPRHTGTHGIAYTSVDGQLYVECTNPYGTTCDATATTAKCPGSLWQIDPAQLYVDRRTSLNAPAPAVWLSSRGGLSLSRPSPHVILWRALPSPSPSRRAAPITPTKPARTRLASPLASDIINKVTAGVTWLGLPS